MALWLTRLTILAAIIVTAAAASTVGALSALAGNPCFHGYEMPASSDAAASAVQANLCDFAPTVARVAPGTTVTFVNDSAVSHLITGANQAWGSRDVQLHPNSSVSYSFQQPGIYPYACALHEGMTGAIVVGDAAGTATASDAGTVRAEAPAMAGVAAAGAGAAGLVLGAAGLWFTTRRRRE
jgi:plastocyanin